jgi:carboxyl-terminal processing protease
MPVYAGLGAKANMNRAAILGLLFIGQLAACGGDDGEEVVPKEILPSTDYEARCAMPRSGTDQVTGEKFTDEKANVLTEQLWLRSWINETYLWYQEVPELDPKKFKTAVDYFDALKTPTITPSGKDKDQFHFTFVTTEWEALAGSGTEASYGLEWALLQTRPPRRLVVAFVTANTPAALAGMKRGTEVVSIDGVAVVDGSDTDTLNNGISPSDVNQAHKFVVTDLGEVGTHEVTMTSAKIDLQPVQSVQVLPLAGEDKVGYMLFTDHIATAEKGLFDAITTLKAQGITDLVLDIRYNGGGFLDIAAELGFMIAGPSAVGKVFERESFNDKHLTTDIFGRALEPTPFIDRGEGFSVSRGTLLPHLDLPRVFVLTGPGTCSASEAVMNGLAGAGVEVIQIGETTCGKPYGFFPQDNCGTTYFAIQFQGVNDKGFGDYADGFVPGVTDKGCVVPDDFSRELGSPEEGRLAAALNYRATGTCPAALAPRTEARATELHQAGEALRAKPLWRQNRILVRP